MAAGRKLLVADDSLTIQKVIRLALSSEGYEIQAISDGSDAIQQISLFNPDLVLIDVSLPTLSAFEIKRAVNGMEDFAHTRFILMSSAFEKIDEAQAQELGFHGRLTKPFDPAHLRQVLQDVLKTSPKSSNTNPALANSFNNTNATVASAMNLGKPQAPKQFPTHSNFEFDAHEFTNPQLRSYPQGASAPSQFPSNPFASSKTNPGMQAPPSQFPDSSDSDSSSLGPKDTNFGIELEMPVNDTEIHLEPPAGFPNSFGDDDEDSNMDLTPPPLPASREEAPSYANESSSGNQSSNDEIKHLTESTIRMSGLDDFDWTVNDSSLKAPASLADDGGTHFQMKPAESAEPSQRHSFSPFSNEAPSQSQSQSQSPSQMPSHSQNQSSVHSRPSVQAPSRPTGFPQQTAPAEPSVTQEQIEEMVRKQVQQSLQSALTESLKEMAQKLLPEVAERVLKAEINKLLNEKN